MELGTVYATLGSQVVVVEALSAILMGADADLVALTDDLQVAGVMTRGVGLGAQS